jgi:hypothetical protein
MFLRLLSCQYLDPRHEYSRDLGGCESRRARFEDSTSEVRLIEPSVLETRVASTRSSRNDQFYITMVEVEHRGIGMGGLR